MNWILIDSLITGTVSYSAGKKASDRGAPPFLIRGHPPPNFDRGAPLVHGCSHNQHNSPIQSIFFPTVSLQNKISSNTFYICSNLYDA